MLRRGFYFAKRAFSSNNFRGTQPSLFFYENHTDPATKAVICELLPYFASRGLGTFCFEYDHSINKDDFENTLLTSATEAIFEAMESNERTESLSTFLSHGYMLNILAGLTSNKINYKGIDEDLGVNIRHADPRNPFFPILLTSIGPRRDAGMAQRLASTMLSGSGGVFALMGADHENGVHSRLLGHLGAKFSDRIISFHVHTETEKPIKFENNNRIYTVPVNPKAIGDSCSKVKEIVEERIARLGENDRDITRA